MSEYVVNLTWGNKRKQFPTVYAEEIIDALEEAKSKYPQRKYHWDEIGVRKATERDLKWK